MRSLKPLSNTLKNLYRLRDLIRKAREEVSTDKSLASPQSDRAESLPDIDSPKRDGEASKQEKAKFIIETTRTLITQLKTHLSKLIESAEEEKKILEIKLLEKEGLRERIEQGIPDLLTNHEVDEYETLQILSKINGELDENEEENDDPNFKQPQKRQRVHGTEEKEKDNMLMMI